MSVEAGKPVRVGAGKVALKAAAPAVGKPFKAAMYIDYVPSKGLELFARAVGQAPVFELVETERRGVPARLLKDLAISLNVPGTRLFTMLGIPKATAEKKIANNDLVTGAGGTAALGMVRLLDIARKIVANSTSPEAKDFNTMRWLGGWLERPQPALGGKRPSQLLDTPTGTETVATVLRALESGAYL